MIIKKVIDAAVAFQHLGNVDIKGYQKKFELLKLYKKAMEQIEFFSQEERKIAERYGTLDGTNIRFSNNEKQKEYMRRHEELSLVEIEDFPNKILLCEENLVGVEFSLADMSALEPFIDFQ